MAAGWLTPTTLEQCLRLSDWLHQTTSEGTRRLFVSRIGWNDPDSTHTTQHPHNTHTTQHTHTHTHKHTHTHLRTYIRTKLQPHNHRIQHLCIGTKWMPPNDQPQSERLQMKPIDYHQESAYIAWYSIQCIIRWVNTAQLPPITVIHHCLALEAG